MTPSTAGRLAPARTFPAVLRVLCHLPSCRCDGPGTAVLPSGCPHTLLYCMGMPLGGSVHVRVGIQPHLGLGDVVSVQEAFFWIFFFLQYMNMGLRRPLHSKESYPLSPTSHLWTQQTSDPPFSVIQLMLQYCSLKRYGFVLIRDCLPRAVT